MHLIVYYQFYYRYWWLDDIFLVPERFDFFVTWRYNFYPSHVMMLMLLRLWRLQHHWSWSWHFSLGYVFLKIVVTLIWTFSITVLATVKVTIVYGVLKINRSLRWLRFECFINIHIINRTSLLAAWRHKYCFSSCADGIPHFFAVLVPQNTIIRRK